MNVKVIIPIILIAAILMFIVLQLSHNENKETEIDDALHPEESPSEHLEEPLKESLNKQSKEPLNEENIKANLFSIYNEIDTYKINVKGVITQKVFFTTVDVNIDAAGQADNKNQRMQIDMNLSIPIKGAESTGLYIIEDFAYKKQSGEWIKKELNEIERRNMWDKNNFIKREIELINASEVEFTGNETAGGARLSVVKITPEKELLKGYAKSWLEQFSEIGPEKYRDLLDVSGMEFKNATVKYWIEKDTYLITKEYFQSDVVIAGENYGIKISAEIYDYNKSLNIVLPNETLP